jgi:Ulp1 protease family, C-terminal catalytic domain
MLGTLFLLLIMALLLLAAIFFFTPPPPAENKKPTTETTNWEYQQEQAKKESQAEKNKEWFSPQRWLTDQEIDWATKRLEKDNRFKILPAHQFHYVKEAGNKIEAKAHLAFPELLNELTSFSGKLVFIPVNNPDFHWSLLVYETNTKCFYHFDTLKGANWEYAKPLCEEILSFLLENWQSASYHLKTKHDIKQGNGYDCGVTAITLIKRVSEKYQGNLEEIELGTFDFKEERNYWRGLYLKEQK